MVCMSIINEIIERRRHNIECAELTRKREDLTDSREERTLMAITLLCCKIAQENAPFGYSIPFEPACYHTHNNII
jgi:hypothetical protein